MDSNLITLPEFSLVLLVGVSGSGKTTFARRRFLPTQTLSSDRFRAMISDNENRMDVSRDAFEILYLVTRKRLSQKRLTVIDATNIQDYGRRILLDIAAEFGAPTVAIILNISEDACVKRAMNRADRVIPLDVVFEQFGEFNDSIEAIRNEGFHAIYALNGEEAIDQAIVSISDVSHSKPEDISSFSQKISLSPISQEA